MSPSRSAYPGYGYARLESFKKRNYTLTSAGQSLWYVNGTNAELYCERYDWMYNYIKDHNMVIFSDETYSLPSIIDYTVNPMIQFYENGSRRIGIYP